MSTSKSPSTSIAMTSRAPSASVVMTRSANDWDPSLLYQATVSLPADAASPEAKKRDSGASCPSPPDYVPTRKLRFGDTLVLSDDLEILD